MGSVLDTSVIIEIARGNNKVLEKVLSLDKNFYVTSITIFEIFVGRPSKEELLWINSLPVLPFNSESARTAAYIFKKLKEKRRSIKFKDLFIGGVALTNGYRLITLDKDFEILRDFGLDVSILTP